MGIKELRNLSELTNAVIYVHVCIQ